MDAVDRGRAAYSRRDWREAFALLSGADDEAPLAIDDLWRLAWSAALTDHDDAHFRALERAYQRLVDDGQCRRAAYAAFWIGYRLLHRGEHGRGGGWLGRAQRLVERDGAECVEHGYLLLAQVRRHLAGDQPAEARAVAEAAAAIGERFGDADLVALARSLEGHARCAEGRFADGVALLDEVMVAATAEGLSPVVTGIVYCTVIACCQHAYAFDRAREWTDALARWCDREAERGTFNGTCLVHRAAILELGGEWRGAVDEIERARELLARSPDPRALAESHYQQAEILRLRGEHAAAEQAYRRASDLGGEAQPGLALLRLAQGRADEAVGSIRRALDTTATPLRRVRFLPASVEILLGAGDLDGARAACDELERIAGGVDSAVVGAIAAHARGAMRLADGDAPGAVEPLRRAFAVWHALGAPYIAARIRVLVGRACAALGDRDGAALELDAARQVFARLGAAPDLAALDADAAPPRAHGLTERELQVLRLLATGKSNKEIASELDLSERTIDRHVSNIFDKVDVHSRAAATAYAYEHGLI